MNCVGNNSNLRKMSDSLDIPPPSPLERTDTVSTAEEKLRTMPLVNGIDQWKIWERLPISNDRRDILLAKFQAEAYKKEEEKSLLQFKHDEELSAVQEKEEKKTT